MRLISIGVDHHFAPQEVRQRLAFDGEQLPIALNQLRAQFVGVEFAIVSTCNRVEIYAAGDPSDVPQIGDLTAFLAQFQDLQPDDFATHLVDFHDEEAIEHLFRVASSIESLVVGEGQIQGQVKEAYEAAKRAGSVGPILHEIFQQSARVGKRVRESTGLDRGRLSIASVAVDVARGVFDHFSDKTVLVIGVGKMGELTLRHLSSLQPGRVLVTNRNVERAEAAARDWSGQAYRFEDLEEALVEADLVVSTTASAEPIVSFETYNRVWKRRQHRHSLILDIAIPRDFDPRINSLETVLLYGVDDLEAQAKANLKGRLRAVERASNMIRDEAASCAEAIRHRRHAGSVLRQLGDYSDNVRSKELGRLFSSRPHLTEDDRKAIELTLHRFQNQLLHHPRTALRTASKSADNSGHALLDAVRQLFGLTDSNSPKASEHS